MSGFKLKLARISSAVVLAGMVGVAMPSAAQAAVPSSSFLVRTLAQRHQGYKTIRIRTNLFDAGVLAQPLKTTTLVDAARGVYRVMVTDPSGVVLAALERNFGPPASASKESADMAAAADDEGGSPVERTEKSPSTAGWVLLSPSALGLARELISQGVPVRLEKTMLKEKSESARRGTERLGVRRLSKKISPVAWVIGETPLPSDPVTDESDRGPYSQLWLVKDTFTPARLVLRRTSGDEIELSFENPRSVREFSFPRELTLKSDSKLRAREELQELDVNGELPEFKRALTVQGWTEAGQKVDPAVKDVVKLFLQYLR